MCTAEKSLSVCHVHLFTWSQALLNLPLITRLFAGISNEATQNQRYCFMPRVP